MDNPHLGLLISVGELGAMMAGSPDIQSFLEQGVRLVAHHMRAQVSSIYLYDEATEELVLQATQGLNPASVGRVRLHRGEGLVGLCHEERRPIHVDRASENPHYRYFAETGEAAFEAFLAVPILLGTASIGVLTVQRPLSQVFHEHDILTLRAVASQLASSIEHARVLMHLRSVPERGTPRPLPLRQGEEDRDSRVLSPGKDVRSPRSILVKGIPASPGIASGPAHIFAPHTQTRALLPEHPREDLGPSDLTRALEATRAQLAELQRRMEKRLPEMVSLIFTAQQIMLKDSTFIDRITERIEKGLNPPEALYEVCTFYMDTFASSSQAYLREKAHDVEDLMRRVMGNLLQDQSDGPCGCQGAVVIASNLYPSDIISLALEGIAGIVLVSGGVTSHVSILVRSLEIPLIISTDAWLMNLAPGTEVLLDATQGNIYLDPTPKVRERFQEREETHTMTSSAAMNEETRTRDGIRVSLQANINLLSELPLARRLKAQGVGLYRTEFPFMIRATPPSEEEQLVVYRTLVREMAALPVTFRTLDVGGDKLLAYFDHASEPNPALGLRSIRFSLKHTDLFAQQLRAILRAGAGAPELRIMFPLISSTEEFLQAASIVHQAREDLTREGLAHHPSPAIGMMIELPAVVEIMDELVQVVDFFSIGTNDFIQYLLGVDRTNELVADFYLPHHPAVLRSLARVVGVARDAGKEISVCGEMAHEPDLVAFLLGIGVRTFSLDPRYLPQIQRTIQSLSLDEAQESAGKLLRSRTGIGSHWADKGAPVL